MVIEKGSNRICDCGRGVCGHEKNLVSIRNNLGNTADIRGAYGATGSHVFEQDHRKRFRPRSEHSHVIDACKRSEVFAETEKVDDGCYLKVCGQIAKSLLIRACANENKMDVMTGIPKKRGSLKKHVDALKQYHPGVDANDFGIWRDPQTAKHC